MEKQCLECDGDLTALVENDNSVFQWYCYDCNLHHGIIKGEFQLVPAEGKISDWPELQENMNQTIEYLFKHGEATLLSDEELD